LPTSKSPSRGSLQAGKPRRRRSPQFLVSGITKHPRYPRLNVEKDAALLVRAKEIAVNIFRDIAENTLPKLDFDARSIEVYQKAALKAFRDALPASNGSAMVH
jgi:hypothetical protein